jgi:hypothetical protein
MVKKNPVTHLYRLENPSIYNKPDGVIWHEDVRGQWFHSDIDNTRGYIRQVVVDRSGDGAVVDGTQLVIAHPLMDELNQYRAEIHPIASTLHYGSNDFIIPRDGSVPITEISIDWLLGRLRNNIYKRESVDKAQRRIKILSQLAILAWDIKN